jgi:glycosyltransferase involved in cell wall biosynthesis
MSHHRNDFPVSLSIGILAWNEESSIRPMLASLFEQSIFRLLAERGERCEVICLANGCSDGTVPVTREIFAEQERSHPARAGLSAWVADIPTPGRNNAWNQFIHEFSAREARYLCVMDADIVFNRPDTLELVLRELELHPHVGGASDWPVKAVSQADNPSWRERLSLATSEMTGTIAGRLNGMLYCLRTPIARNLYLPRDVVANDDGFFKAAICTDFFRTPLDPSRVVSVREATHLYEPYLSYRDVVNNQKRQMIGQTTVYVIVEYLMNLPLEQRANLAETLREHEARDPDWLKKLIDAHLGHTRFFWQLFPGILGFRWRRLGRMPGLKKVTHFPAAVAGFVVTLIACWQAARFLRRGVTTYWPKTTRNTIPVAPALGADERTPFPTTTS